MTYNIVRSLSSSIIIGLTIVVLSIVPVKADVTLKVEPVKAPVGTEAAIWVMTSEHEKIVIEPGDFTVTDPNGVISKNKKRIEFHDLGFALPYPGPDWDPPGSVDTPGKYKVRLKYSIQKSALGPAYDLTAEFERYISDGGIAVPVDTLSLLTPYIGVASTISVATVAAAIYAKRVKRRKEKP